MPTTKKPAGKSSKRASTKMSKTGAKRPAKYAPRDTDLKAQCIAALLAGQGLTETASQYKVAKSTLKGWRDSLPPDKIAHLRTKQGERLDDKIADFLEQIIDTTTAIAETVADPKYIRAHPPEGVAVLFGVMTDKGFRILEAVQRAADPQFDEDDPQTAEGQPAGTQTPAAPARAEGATES